MATSRITVMPRDLRPGDRVDQMDRDLNLIPVTITEVEKVRVARRTAYRVHLDGDRKPFVLNPGHPITVERDDA